MILVRLGGGPLGGAYMLTALHCLASFIHYCCLPLAPPPARRAPCTEARRHWTQKTKLPLVWDSHEARRPSIRFVFACSETEWEWDTSAGALQAVQRAGIAF
jgi:hypothetical protein